MEHAVRVGEDDLRHNQVQEALHVLDPLLVHGDADVRRGYQHGDKLGEEIDFVLVQKIKNRRKC